MHITIYTDPVEHRPSWAVIEGAASIEQAALVEAQLTKAINEGTRVYILSPGISVDVVDS